ncbi:3-oxoacyl-[acyl-carrier protein] reductase [Conyzicola nivalis]|uniref:3-oxoacyl-[acyl-carrier protein] reductase n=1 Tax=Conyzicola nivalis TaxID=1477021 RepID=A0ABV2QS69_9MICO
MTRPVALITGVGRTVGIGAGIARTLASDGWDLALSYWSPADEAIFGSAAAHGLDELIVELEASGARVAAIPADLERVDAAASVVSKAVEHLGPVDALVLSHAWDIDSGLLDTSVEQFDKHFAINTRASWMLIVEFARQAASGGAIVALTSDHTAGNLPYGASKGALDRIVIAAAKELAAQGISANVLNPGPIDTGWMTDDVRQTLVAMQPSGRLGTPADVANLVAFLVSERGRWVTGQLLTSDGGFSISI